MIFTKHNMSDRNWFHKSIWFWSIWVNYGSVWSVVFSQLSCGAKTLILDITCNLFNQVFHTSMLIDIIDIFRFIPHSTTLTMGEGYKVSTIRNQLASFFSHTFRPFQRNVDVMLKQFMWNVLVLLFSEIYWIKGNKCSFTVSKKLKC